MFVQKRIARKEMNIRKREKRIKWARDSIKINAVKKNPIPSEKSVE